MSPDWADEAEAVPYARYGDPQSLDLYAFVGNNPLTHVDNDGHCVEDLCIGEAAVTYAIVTAAAATTIAYLHTPQGQQAIQAGRQLVNAGTHALGNIFSSARPGTRGKPDHQQTAKEEAARIRGQQEVRIPIPGGNKGTRVADAAEVDATGKYKPGGKIVQVIRPMPAGNVPKREKEAAADIEKATGVEPELVPVRQSQSSTLVCSAGPSTGSCSAPTGGNAGQLRGSNF